METEGNTLMKLQLKLSYHWRDSCKWRFAFAFHRGFTEIFPLFLGLCLLYDQKSFQKIFIMGVPHQHRFAHSTTKPR